MSTRCNVIIRTHDGPEWILYRHWDGYPAETGRHLTRLAVLAERRKWTAGQFIAAVLGSLEKNRDPRRWNRGRPHYEPTTAIHGDIEHVYVVDIESRQDAMPNIRIGHGGVGIFEADSATRDPIADAEKFARTVTHDARTFAHHVVNPEIRARNQRIAARAAQAGQQVPRQIREFA